MNVIERARASGRCPPSLLHNEPKEDAFEAAVGKVLDARDLVLATGPNLVDDFNSLLQMANSLDGVPGDSETQKAIVAQRRCIILAIVGATPSNNSSLTLILQNGFLRSVKSWLDDIFSGKIGGVDLLIHMLTNITGLPVTRSIAKESGMVTAIGSIEKHRVCNGTPNEAVIKQRVKQLTVAWNKSVKALKHKDKASADETTKSSAKRSLESGSSANSPDAKKPRVDDAKKSSLNTLLRKVKPGSKDSSTGKESTTLESKSSSPDGTKTSKSGDGSKKASQKKQLKSVKWADHFGGDLSAAKILEGDDSQAQETGQGESSDSWSDRRKRDRLREKELLAQVKKSKLVDDEDDIGMEVPAPKTIQPSTAWTPPRPLPERTDATEVNSKEIAIQTSRMANIRAAQYANEYSVPNSPFPMSDVEQALDMTNQSSTNTQAIPFFVPQVTAPVVAPAQAPTSYSHSAIIPPAVGAIEITMPPTSQTQIGPGGATADFVQSLGLPMFLVGQDVQALQTLASTPSLLSTFIVGNGMYDQARLTNLVQTLSQNAPAQQSQPPMAHMGHAYAYQQPTASPYGPGVAYPGTSNIGNSGGIYGPASSNPYGPGSEVETFGSSWQGSTMRNGYRGDQAGGEGNLHLSGYGPGTTQTDIINLFAPYVQVDEVVMKGTFSFVNTSDPIGANRAREALNGALLGGSAIRIKIAQRKTRDSGHQQQFAGNSSSHYGSNPPAPRGQRNNHQSGFPQSAQGHGGDISTVRDDRGNTATKNLFVAGYGAGTTEQQIKDLFGQHTQIVGIIMKGTFCFVNTSDRASAVRVREMLSGTMLNGGVLRVNFAKETGRLGTSFDLTYSNVSGGGSRSHYGRGF